LEDFGGFIDGEPAKVPQFYYAAFAGIEFRQLAQSFVECKYFNSARASSEQYLVERNSCSIASPLRVPAVAGMIHKNPPDHLRAQGKEMDAIFALDAP
jgi:hypothetical protein